jgi:hypothetical protein
MRATKGSKMRGDKEISKVEHIKTKCHPNEVYPFLFRIRAGTI